MTTSSVEIVHMNCGLTEVVVCDRYRSERLLYVLYCNGTARALWQHRRPHGLMSILCRAKSEGQVIGTTQQAICNACSGTVMYTRIQMTPPAASRETCQRRRYAHPRVARVSQLRSIITTPTPPGDTQAISLSLKPNEDALSAITWRRCTGNCRNLHLDCARRNQAFVS